MREESGGAGFLELIDGLNEAEQRLLLGALGLDEAWAVDADWPSWAHRGQLPPPDRTDWRTWVLMAGRGFGKTLAGAKWVTQEIARSAANTPRAAGARDPLKIALVGATLEDARRVMIEGKSGLLEVADAWIDAWHPSLHRLKFRTGAEATLFSGAHPDRLRGPEHHLAWCDELAKWARPGDTWDMLQLGLRLGAHPRALVTTTPRPGEALKAIMADPDTVVTHGATSANPHTSAAWKRAVERIYAGTRLGRQELEGELLSDKPGALWSVELLEKCRLSSPRSFQRKLESHCLGTEAEEEKRDSSFRWNDVQSGIPDQSTTFTRTVIGVDPPSGGGTCGIVVCVRDEDGIAHVLADHSVTGRTPEGWARAVADAVGVHSSPSWLGEGDHLKGREGVGLDPARALIVAEQNQGGKMVEAVLRTADPSLHVRLVTAHVGKSERAAPVAMLFEAGRVVLHGRLPELEAELLGMIAGGGYEGPGTSPDRGDAMVWALTELMLKVEKVPQVREI